MLFEFIDQILILLWISHLLHFSPRNQFIFGIRQSHLLVFRIFLCIQFALNQHSHAEHFPKSYLYVYILLLVSIEMIHEFLEFLPSSNIGKCCYCLQQWKNVYLRWLWIVVERIEKKTSEQIWIEKPKAHIQHSYICITNNQYTWSIYYWMIWIYLYLNFVGFISTVKNENPD